MFFELIVVDLLRLAEFAVIMGVCFYLASGGGSAGQFTSSSSSSSTSNGGASSNAPLKPPGGGPLGGPPGGLFGGRMPTKPSDNKKRQPSPSNAASNGLHQQNGSLLALFIFEAFVYSPTSTIDRRLETSLLAAVGNVERTHFSASRAQRNRTAGEMAAATASAVFQQ